MFEKIRGLVRFARHEGGQTAFTGWTQFVLPISAGPNRD